MPSSWGRRSICQKVSHSFRLINNLEEPKTAFETLAKSLNESLRANDEFLVFLLRQLSNLKLTSVCEEVCNSLISTKNPKANKEVLISVSDFF